MEDLVEVLDLTFLYAVAGNNGDLVQRTYTVRPHLGDEVLDSGTGSLTIQYAPRKIAGRDPLPGKRVTLATSDFVAMEKDVRLEPRQRRSIAHMINPERAEVAALKSQHGVADVPAAS